MSPRKPGPQPKNTDKRTKVLDSAVRKLEAKEAKQDKDTGKRGQPVRSIGRSIRDGWVAGA